MLNMEEERKVIEEKIITLLKQNPHGMTTSDIARALGMNRITVAKYLEVLKAEGIVDYKQIGKMKVWFLNEDFAILEILKSGKDYIKMLRRGNDGSITLANEIEMFVVPSEFMLNLLIELIKNTENYDKILLNVGRKIGRQMVHIYEIYSGIKISSLKNFKNILQSLADFFLKGGWGILKDFVLNERRKDLIVIVENSRIPDALRGINDPALKKIENKPICYILLGFFMGLMEAVFNDYFRGEERKCLFKGDPYCGFYIYL